MNNALSNVHVIHTEERWETQWELDNSENLGSNFPIMGKIVVLSSNIDCGYTPRQGGSNKYPQSMF